VIELANNSRVRQYCIPGSPEKEGTYRIARRDRGGFTMHTLLDFLRALSVLSGQGVLFSDE